jgi:hypothetical protein
VLLSTETLEANTAVVVGSAPWRCLVSNGALAEVMSMADEGRL